MKYSHLHGAAPEALVQLHGLQRGRSLLVLRAMAPLEIAGLCLYHVL